MFLLKNTNANLDFNNIQIHGKNFGEFEIRFGHLKVGQICRLVYDNGWAHVYFNFDSQMQVEIGNTPNNLMNRILI